MNTRAITPANPIVPGQAEVQRLLEAAVIEQGYPGAITEIRNGTQRWFGSAGVADTATGRPRTPQERFRVGSITKTFTATLVLQLAAEYRLSLDDTVEKWLPGLVQGNGHDGGEVTIRQLLNHTSGIFAYTLDEGMLERYWTPKLLEHRFDKPTPEDLVKIAVSYPADFQPGQGWGYSNTNFVLAAMIIEKAAGMSYADAVAYRIARPLKLAGTYAPGGETGFRGPTRAATPSSCCPTPTPRFTMSPS
ncbi:serine hydrolase domain-containing protein [Streptosporangium sp. G11]|uniref:serine hydrolase domain-containing protein n=1 Tax=Streptosporangium sp. G11 TaxID=3436926 RepID=UPI003EB74E03